MACNHDIPFDAHSQSEESASSGLRRFLRHRRRRQEAPCTLVFALPTLRRLDCSFPVSELYFSLFTGASASSPTGGLEISQSTAQEASPSQRNPEDRPPVPLGIPMPKSARPRRALLPQSVSHFPHIPTCNWHLPLYQTKFPVLSTALLHEGLVSHKNDVYPIGTTTLFSSSITNAANCGRGRFFDV